MSVDNKQDNAGASELRVSRGLETLMVSIDAIRESRAILGSPATDFDVVIIGSGYGGSVAAYELSGLSVKDENGKLRPLSVCVLERGNEYLPGAFPKTPEELPGYLRFCAGEGNQPSGNLEGLHDLRISADMSAWLANGVGGGSLINAGVLDAPHPNVFEGSAKWPEALRSWGMDSSRGPNGDFEMMKRLLGGGSYAAQNNIAPSRTAQFEKLAGRTPRKPYQPWLQIKSKGSCSDHVPVAMSDCIGCGDCATGCNFNAKISHDVNLLRVAVSRRTVQVYRGATALRIDRGHVPGSPSREFWSVDVVHTSAHLRKRQTAPLEIRADKIIVAAGTLGSTELLLRTQSERLKFGEHLGRGLSGNGDSIAATYNLKDEVNLFADPTVPFGKRAVGPTIVNMIDRRDSASKSGPDLAPLVVQDIAIPSGMYRIVAELLTFSKMLHGLSSEKHVEHRATDFSPGKAADPLMLHPGELRRTLLVAMFGDDGAKGSVQIGNASNEMFAEGTARIRWTANKRPLLYDQQLSGYKALSKIAFEEAAVLNNPVWRLLPEGLSTLLSNFPDGPSITVHPLGGCCIGEDFKTGVVNEYGQVFKVGGPGQPPGDRVHDGLVVLDGSIVPCALGINPSLTIAALAKRSIDNLAKKWNYVTSGLGTPDSGHKPARAVYRRVQCEDVADAAEVKTTVILTERMHGDVTLDGRLYKAQLTLAFRARQLRSMFEFHENYDVAVDRKLEVDPDSSELRIFETDAWEELTDPTVVHSAFGKADDRSREIVANFTRLDGGREEVFREKAIAIFGVKGSLTLFRREPSTAAGRRKKALRAYFLSRLVRELLLDFSASRRKRSSAWFQLGRQAEGSGRKGLWSPAWEYWRQLKTVCTHVGEARLWEYDLDLTPHSGARSKVQVGKNAIAIGGETGGVKLVGKKVLRYERFGSPLLQTATLQVESLLGEPQPSSANLCLDLAYLARERKALLEFGDFHDAIQGYMDLLSFGLYFLRILISIQLFAFRLPDERSPDEPQRLPGSLPRFCPSPQFAELTFPRQNSAVPVVARLTRYERAKAQPVLLIHGYSAGGTTFAHPSLRPGLADYLWENGFDVWVADLRTSIGMPTATHPWRFEDVAFEDIPVLIRHIKETTGRPKVDVFAHCMGAAMTSMAIMSPPESGDLYFDERVELPGSIGNLVLSQICPFVSLTPANRLRALVLGQLRYILPLDDYQFRARPNVSLVDHLFDRVLALIPYPTEDRKIENPFLALNRSYVSGRHRLDALYGRTFTLRNMEKDVLRHFDDFFGPLSIDTVNQVGRFSRVGQLTDEFGEDMIERRDNDWKRWREVGRTHYFHAEQNGLSDARTLNFLEVNFANHKLPFNASFLKDAGHQDCLIGRNRIETFRSILAALNFGK